MTENAAVTAAVEAAKSSPIVKAADAIGQVVVPCECIGCGDEVPVGSDGYCLACGPLDDDGPSDWDTYREEAAYGSEP